MGRSRVTDDQLRAAVPGSANLHGLLAAVGLVPCGANYAIVRSRLERLGLLHSRFLPQQPRGPARILPPLPADQLPAVVAASRSFAQALRALGLGTGAVEYRHLQKAVRRQGLSTAHFTGQSWARGAQGRGRPLEQVLVLGRRTCSGSLRQRLVREGLLPACCSGCGRASWRGQPIALELDHVNGDRDDNRLENLRLLCPNCHAQTDTWRGRNRGRAARTTT